MIDFSVLYFSTVLSSVGILPIPISSEIIDYVKHENQNHIECVCTLYLLECVPVCVVFCVSTCFRGRTGKCVCK